MDLVHYQTGKNTIYNEKIYSNAEGTDMQLKSVADLNQSDKEAIQSFNPIRDGEIDRRLEPITDFEKKNGVSLLDLSEIDITNGVFSDNMCKKITELAILDRAIFIFVLDKLGKSGKIFSAEMQKKIMDTYGIHVDREELREGGYIKVRENPFQTGYSKFESMASASTFSPAKMAFRATEILKKMGQVVINGPADYAVDEEDERKILEQQHAIFEESEDNGPFKLYKIVNIQSLWSRHNLNLNEEMIAALEKSEDNPEDPQYKQYFNMDEKKIVEEQVRKILKERRDASKGLFTKGIKCIESVCRLATGSSHSDDEPSSKLDKKLESIAFLVVREVLFPNYYIIFMPLVPHLSDILNPLVRKQYSAHMCNLINNFSFKTKIRLNPSSPLKEEVVVDSNLWLDQTKRYMPAAYESINADFIDWWNTSAKYEHKATGLQNLEKHNCGINRTFCKTPNSKKSTYLYNSCIHESKIDCCSKPDQAACMSVGMNNEITDSNLTKRIKSIAASHGIDLETLKNTFGKPDITFVGTSLGGGSGQLGILWLIDRLNKDNISIYNIDGVFFNSIRSCNVKAFQIMKRYNNIMPVHFINSRLDFYKKNSNFYIPTLFIDPLTIMELNPELSDIPTRYILLDNNVNEEFSGWQLNSSKNGLIPLAYSAGLDNCHIYKMNDNTLNKYSINNSSIECLFDLLFFAVMSGHTVLKTSKLQVVKSVIGELTKSILSIRVNLFNGLMSKIFGHDAKPILALIDSILQKHSSHERLIFEYYYNDITNLHSTLSYYTTINLLKTANCQDSSV